MKHLPKEFLTIGRGAEYVLCSDDAILFMSGGLTGSIRLVFEGGVAKLVCDGEHVIFEGKAADATLAFLDIKKRLACHGLRRRVSRIASHVKSLAITCAAISIVVATTLVICETHFAGPLQVTAPETAQMPSLSELPQFKGAPQGLENSPLADALPTIVPGDDTALKVIPRPDFLADEKASNETAPAEKAADLKADVATAKDTAVIASATGLPPYTPDLYKDALTTTTDTPPEEASVGKKVMPQIDDTLVKDIKAAQDSAPIKNAEAKDPTSDAKTSGKEVAKADSPKSIAKPTAEEQEAIKSNADVAVKKMMESGMTPAAVRKLLIDLQELEATGHDELTPEMMQSLPEEVAALLADKGMNAEAQESGEINILPTEVVDSFRGKDGIATIPENFSWYARKGGPVTLPLPGGGDVKKPEDLKEFGLIP